MVAVFPEPTNPDAEAVAPAAQSEAPPAEARKPRREGLARIRVKAHGHSTSVSLDALLYHFLAGKLGGAKAVQAWAQRVVLEIDDLEARGATTPPRDVDASLSRLVQRQGMRLLWSGTALN